MRGPAVVTFLLLLCLLAGSHASSPISFLKGLKGDFSRAMARGAVAHTSSGHSLSLKRIIGGVPSKFLEFAPEFDVTTDPKGKMAWFKAFEEDKFDGIVAGVLKREKQGWKILQLNISCTSDCDLLLPRRKESIPLTAMTFNIRYGTASDGLNSWYLRDHMVFEVMNNYFPDIMGLQEALKFQIDEITENVPGYKWFGVGREDGNEQGEYAAVFYKPETLQLIEQGTFWYCDTPSVPGCTSYGNNLPRIATWGRFLHVPTGRTFHFYNTHLDHQSAISREKSSLQLISHIESRNVQEPFMITGDFNCQYETSPEIESLKDFGFDDSFRVLFPNASETGTFHSFTGSKTGTKIDFVFTPRETFLGGQASIKNALIIHDNEDGRYPSDHFPVFAEFVLP